MLFSILWTPLFAQALLLCLTSSLTSADPPAALLTAGVTERTLAAGDVHRYHVHVEEGQFSAVRVAQQGIDIVVSLSDAAGTERREVNFCDGPRGLETISWIAKSPGEMRLEIRSRRAGGTEGRYVLTVDGPRAATAADLDRMAAEQALADAYRLRESGARSAGGDAAIEALSRALTLWRALGDRFFEAVCLNEQGFTWSTRAEYRKALEAQGEALELARSLGERGLEAKVLHDTGFAQARLGDFPSAATTLDRALALRREIGDRYGEASTLNSLGVVLGALGQGRKAIAVQRDALTLRRALGDRAGEAPILSNLAVRHMANGDLQAALDLLLEALPLYRELGDRRSAANALHNLGTVYFRLGEEQTALEYFRQALAEAQALDDRYGAAAALASLAVLHIESDDLTAALRELGEALALQTAMGNVTGRLNILQNMASAQHKLGHSAEAARLLDESLALAEKTGDVPAQVSSLLIMGRVSAEGGDEAKAGDAFRKALGLSKVLGDRQQQAAALTSLAKLEYHNGSWAEARGHMEAALDLHEAARREMASHELRASFAALGADAYASYVYFLLELHQRDPDAGYQALAFEASERRRVQGLRELLAESRVDLKEGVDPALLERERSASEQLAFRLERQMRLLAGPHDAGQAGAAETAVQASRLEHQQVEGQIRATSPRYASLRETAALTLAAVQQRILDPGTLLLEYEYREGGSRVFVVGPTSLHHYSLAPASQIEAVARRAYELLSRSSDLSKGGRGARVPGPEIPAELDETLADLSRMVLGPLAGELGDKRLVVVADSPLQYLPFAVLPVPGRPGVRLIDEHEVVAVPSVSLLAVLREEAARRSPPAKTLAVLADPVFDGQDARVKAASRADRRVASGVGVRSALGMGAIPRLSFSRREAEAMAALVPKGQARVALDFEASRQTASDPTLADYRFVHFATHGFYNNTNPDLSGLVLSLVDHQGAPQDGFLSTADILNLRLSADLVVLSGCRTALGKEVKGEGVVGLSRAFMYAGTPRVLASLWKVDDAATAALMARLYEGLLVDRLRPVAALRQAQRAIAAQPRWRHPYFWGGFQIQGDWN